MAHLRCRAHLANVPCGLMLCYCTCTAESVAKADLVHIHAMYMWGAPVLMLPRGHHAPHRIMATRGVLFGCSQL